MPDKDAEIVTRWQKILAYRRKLAAFSRAQKAKWIKQHARNLERIRAAKRVLARHAPKPSKPSGPARGIDVSSFQGAPDFAQVKAAGYSFVICKATEGEGFVDATFQRNVKAARAAGLKVGAYHFLRPRPGRTGAQEADDFVKQLRIAGLGKGDLRPAIDIETTDLGQAQTRDYTRQFAAEVKRLTGIQPMLYTFPAFLQWNDTFGCPLWIAHFGVVKPTIPRPWKGFVIWQHSSKGAVPGVHGNVDLNVCPNLKDVIA